MYCRNHRLGSTNPQLTILNIVENVLIAFITIAHGKMSNFAKYYHAFVQQINKSLESYDNRTPFWLRLFPALVPKQIKEKPKNATKICWTRPIAA